MVDRRRRKEIGFVLACAVLAYVLLSVAIAANTLDKCGSDDAPKHWVYFPPAWECDSQIRF